MGRANPNKNTPGVQAIEILAIMLCIRLLDPADEDAPDK
jgi:hypothetical protein